MRTPVPSAPVTADLVLDTRSSAARVGMRALDFADRRLLYETPGAHVELRIPPVGSSEEPQWLYGLWVPTEPGVSPEGLQVTLHQAAEPVTIAASRTGDFALPFDAARAFRLVCKQADGLVVDLRADGTE